MSQRKGCCFLKNDQHTEHLLETKTKQLYWCWGLQELRSGKPWKIITTPYQLPLSFSQQQQHLSVRYFLQRKGVTQWKVEAWVPWLTLIENPSPHEALPTICQRVYCIPTGALLSDRNEKKKKNFFFRGSPKVTFSTRNSLQNAEFDKGSQVSLEGCPYFWPQRNFCKKESWFFAYMAL